MNTSYMSYMESISSLLSSSSSNLAISKSRADLNALPPKNLTRLSPPPSCTRHLESLNPQISTLRNVSFRRSWWWLYRLTALCILCYNYCTAELYCSPYLIIHPRHFTPISNLWLVDLPCESTNFEISGPKMLAVCPPYQIDQCYPSPDLSHPRTDFH